MELSPGWIHKKGVLLHEKYMLSDEGSILEGGCAAGRLFNYLYNKKPNWKYIGVDDWTNEKVYLQKDLDLDYFDDELGERITEEMFKQYCPFAVSHNMRFENFNDGVLYDIVSIGQISKKINWKDTYKKALTMIKDDGYVIGRNLKHKVYGPIIEEAIKGYTKIDQVWGYFVLKK